MAQDKKVEAGAFVVDGPGVLPLALPNAYGEVLLLVLKAPPNGAADYYSPLATAPLQDLPEGLRRQLVREVDGGLAALALAPLAREDPAARFLLVHAAGYHPEDLCNQLTGAPIDRNTGKGARDAIMNYAEFSVLRFEDDEDREVYRLDVNPIPQELENIRIPARVVEVFDVLRIDAAAFAHRPVTPFALDPSGLVLVRGNGETLGDKLVGNNRSDENGATYSYGGRRSSNAVQVVVDQAVGAKSGDPMAPGVREAGAGAGSEGNLSAVLGIVVASSAVTAVAAGTFSPAVALGSFLALLGGLVAAMAGVRGP